MDDWLYEVLLKPYGVTEEEAEELFVKSGLGVEEMFSSTAEKVKLGIEREKRKVAKEVAKEVRMEIARKMLKEGAEENFVGEVTGLSLKKVKEIKDEK
ncbi:hypothetical protein [Caldicellulosiruptor acetigenus]|uniref:hypothetical protein n=1 Tax=Caldicellulosiruptor acetigenus TaxID=301953 RepID=UPI0001E99D44|nr:hypothetical protein [Caldicellulosiruptor acetigenus]